MTERLVCVGVHPDVLAEVAEYKEKGDPLTQEMIDDTIDEILDELHFLGALDKRRDTIHIAFQSDDTVDTSLPYRVITVKEPVYDEQYENIIGESEEQYMFHFESDNNN